MILLDPSASLLESDNMCMCINTLQESAWDIIQNCMNLLTIVVPAALPLALSIGISVSFNRLQGKGVYCINPGRILSLGRVDTLCFDKTGTITEDGLNLKGVVVVKKCENETLNTTMGCGELEKDPHAVFRQGQQVWKVHILPRNSLRASDLPGMKFNNTSKFVVCSKGSLSLANSDQAL